MDELLGSVHSEHVNIEGRRLGAAAGAIIADLVHCNATLKSLKCAPPSPPNTQPESPPSELAGTRSVDGYSLPVLQLKGSDPVAAITIDLSGKGTYFASAATIAGLIGRNHALQQLECAASPEARCDCCKLFPTRAGCARSVDGHPLPVAHLKGTSPVSVVNLWRKSLSSASAIIIASLIGGNRSLRELKRAATRNPPALARRGRSNQRANLVSLPRQLGWQSVVRRRRVWSRQLHDRGPLQAVRGVGAARLLARGTQVPRPPFLPSLRDPSLTPTAFLGSLRSNQLRAEGGKLVATALRTNTSIKSLE